jgi:hypothetical protein
MSNLTVTNINSQPDLEGRAKAWVNLNGTGTIAIRDSFGISSVVDNGTGDYTASFTNSFGNTNYHTSSSIGRGTTGISSFWLTGPDGSDPLVGSFQFVTYANNAAARDAPWAGVTFYGDLA